MYLADLSFCQSVIQPVQDRPTWAKTCVRSNASWSAVMVMPLSLNLCPPPGSVVSWQR